MSGAKMRRWILGAMLAAMFAPVSWAETRATAAEAKALVDKALAHVKAVGKEKAFADFTAGGAWTDRDLYIFAYEFNGKNLAFGNKPQMVGKDLSDLKDGNGKPIIKDLAEVARSKGSGWYDYMFTDPLTKKMLPKSSYVVRIPGSEAFLGAGIYK